eukprot:gene15499-20916_t
MEKIKKRTLSSESILTDLYSDEYPIEIQGWINKRSNYLKHWRRRYGYIKNYHIYFCKSPKAPYHFDFDLRYCLSVDVEPCFLLHSSVVNNVIKITTNAGPIFFYPENDMSTTRWVSVLMTILRKVSRGIILYNSINLNEIKQFRVLLRKQFSDVNFMMPGSTGLTLLGAAAEKGRLEFVEHLIDLKCKLDATDQAGNTALFIAIRSENSLVAKYLISKGANINILNGKLKTTCLLAAIQTENMFMVKLLIQHNADVNQPNLDGVTPLMCAINKNSIDCVRVLLSSTLLNVNKTNNNGLAALYIAAKKGYLSMVCELVRANGINLSLGCNKYKPIEIAFINEHHKIVSVLKDYGEILTLTQPIINSSKMDENKNNNLFLSNVLSSHLKEVDQCEPNYSIDLGIFPIPKKTKKKNENKNHEKYVHLKKKSLTQPTIQPQQTFAESVPSISWFQSLKNTIKIRLEHISINNNDNHNNKNDNVMKQKNGEISRLSDEVKTEPDNQNDTELTDYPHHDSNFEFDSSMRTYTSSNTNNKTDNNSSK